MKLVSTAACAVAIFAVSSTAPTVADQSPIPVYAILSMTGPAASTGDGIARTLQAQEITVNRSGGINGRPVKFVILDDASSPERAAQLARELSAKGVYLFVGPNLGSACDAISRDSSISANDYCLSRQARRSDPSGLIIATLRNLGTDASPSQITTYMSQQIDLAANGRPSYAIDPHGLPVKAQGSRSTPSGPEAHPQALIAASSGTTQGAQIGPLTGSKKTGATSASVANRAASVKAHATDTLARYKPGATPRSVVQQTWMFLLWDRYVAQNNGHYIIVSSMFPGNFRDCQTYLGQFQQYEQSTGRDHFAYGGPVVTQASCNPTDSQASALAAKNSAQAQFYGTYDLQRVNTWQDESYVPPGVTANAASNGSALPSAAPSGHLHIDNSYNRSKCIEVGPVVYGQIGGRQLINNCGGKIEVTWCSDSPDDCHLGVMQPFGRMYLNASMWTVGSVPQASSVADQYAIYLFACANDDGLTLPTLTSMTPPRGNCWR